MTNDFGSDVFGKVGGAGTVFGGLAGLSARYTNKSIRQSRQFSKVKGAARQHQSDVLHKGIVDSAVHMAKSQTDTLAHKHRGDQDNEHMTGALTANPNLQTFKNSNGMSFANALGSRDPIEPVSNTDAPAYEPIQPSRQLKELGAPPRGGSSGQSDSSGGSLQRRDRGVDRYDSGKGPTIYARSERLAIEAPRKAIEAPIGNA